MKLNLGCGDTHLVGYVNLDSKDGDNAYPLFIKDSSIHALEFNDNSGHILDESVDEVRASHILEHFPRAQVLDVLKEWVRVLKPNGSLKIAVPDFDWIIREYRREHGDKQWQGYLLGGQTDEDDFHKSVFTEPILRSLLQEVGLVDITRWSDEANDCASLPVSLNLQGTKPAVLESEKPIKIVAVMSAPRVGWLDTMGCAQQALMPLGIELLIGHGAFWGQVLTRCIERVITEGADYILTLDYDSIFTREQVHRLCQLMLESDADVICSVQVRRENEYSMFTIEENGKQVEKVDARIFDESLTKITTGHFGLTLIRVESLLKMSKPYFLAVPNDAGEWNDGRIDEDIYFWKKMRDEGGRVYLANEVRIGHLQLMVTWPDKSFKPRHQYISEWQTDGQPVDCGGDLKVECKT